MCSRLGYSPANRGQGADTEIPPEASLLMRKHEVALGQRQNNSCVLYCAAIRSAPPVTGAVLNFDQAEAVQRLAPARFLIVNDFPSWRSVVSAMLYSPDRFGLNRRSCSQHLSDYLHPDTNTSQPSNSRDISSARDNSQSKNDNDSIHW